MRLPIGLLLAGAVLLPAAAETSGVRPAASEMVLAQRPAGVTPKGAPDPRAEVSPQDEAFVREAALGGMAEIEASEMAQRKASASSVIELARTVVLDQAAANRALSRMAAAREIEIPRELDEERRRVLADLDQLSGPAFDGAYLRSRVSGHKLMIRLLEEEMASSRDPDLRIFARDTLAAVRRHLEAAEQMSAEMTGQAR